MTPTKTAAAVCAVAALAALTTSCTDEKESGIIAVDPSDYESTMYPGTYLWTYTTADGGHQDCTAFPARDGYSAGVRCFAKFPDGTPEVANDVFTGPPNVITLNDDGSKISIDEGGPEQGKELPGFHRITIGDYSCGGMSPNGISCSGPAGRFVIKDGEVTQTGTVIAQETVTVTPTP